MIVAWARTVTGCVVLLAVLSGCLGGGDPVAQKEGTGEERHDLAPLVERFAGLDEARRAIWFSGTLGDDRAPGPASYWIDAVVELPPDVVETLESHTGPLRQSGRPDVVPELEGALPTESLVTSERLRDLVAEGSGWVVDVWLAPDANRLVLVARGE